MAVSLSPCEGPVRSTAIERRIARTRQKGVVGGEWRLATRIEGLGRVTHGVDIGHLLADNACVVHPQLIVTNPHRTRPKAGPAAVRPVGVDEKVANSGFRMGGLPSRGSSR